MHQPPMRFGTFIGPLHDPAHNPTLAIRRDLELVEYLDELGYDEAWIGEHHSNGYETIPSPEIFIAAAAERTKRIRLGTGVISLPYHHPFLVADRMVFLDHLTKGRVIFGVGPGAFPSDSHMMGLKFEDARVHMADSLEAIMRLLTDDDPVTMKSEWFELNEARLNLRPFTYPHFEVSVAAAVSPSGPSLAGKLGVSLLAMAGATEAGFESLRSMWSIVEAQADRYGQTVDRSNWRVVGFYHLADTEEQARKDVRYGLKSLMRFFAAGIPFFPVGKDADWTKPDAIIDFLNESGFAVIGTPDRMSDAVRKYRDQTGGFGCFLAQAHELANREATKYSYELFMREVAPEFQGSNVRSEANIDWIEAQDGRFIQSAANAWQAAKDRYEADNPGMTDRAVGSMGDLSGRLDDKVAFITGAARGQGRSHAIRLAEEGASIIAVDACSPIKDVPYAMPVESDLEETRSLVEAAGGSIEVRVADVRHPTKLADAVAHGITAFGRIDIVVANAGINTEMGPSEEVSDSSWQTVIDVNLTGVWNTVRAALPAMKTNGNGGSIVLTSSVGGAKGFANAAPYVASKHGVIGLMRSLARELATDRIRVNAVLPTTVDTPMVRNAALFELFCPDVQSPTLEDVSPRLSALNQMDTPWIESIDVSNAVLFLASDEARYVTGMAMPIDAGALLL